MFVFLIAVVSASKHRTIMSLNDKAPEVARNAFVAPGASVIGDVKVGANSSIWYGCVLRGKPQVSDKKFILYLPLQFLTFMSCSLDMETWFFNLQEMSTVLVLAQKPTFKIIPLSMLPKPI